MVDVVPVLVATATLLAAGYAHLELPTYAAGRRNVLITRGALIAVGIAFGWVSAATVQGGGPGRMLLAFLTAFGAAHTPAALILFIKRQRREGKS
jgi:hypothetical protein